MPLNPQGLAAVSPHLSWNTAVSFTTNTNWQSYGGESTMSYLSQMAGLAWHNFVSAAAGIGIAIALARGLTRTVPERAPRTIGNFWVDLIARHRLRAAPAVVVLALVARGGRRHPELLALRRRARRSRARKQTLAMGPAASQIAIKQLGTNGGGFFNVNSAHPFENADAASRTSSSAWPILMISAALTYTYGKMARDTRQGWVLFGAMAPALRGRHRARRTGPRAIRTRHWFSLGVEQAAGNMEGKEARFGVSASTLWAVATTDASNGSVNSMHDSYTPLGGLVPLFNIQLGEVIFGGVGAGLYGMLVFVVLSVFIAGLMVGRTPEYLGKKVEAREMKLAMLYILIFPAIILGFSAWSSVAPYGVSSLNNAGPHGLSEILYAYSSGGRQQRLGLRRPERQHAVVGHDDGPHHARRSLPDDHSRSRHRRLDGRQEGGRPRASGRSPPNGALFSALLVGVVVIVGALTFFPALALGPVVEHFLANAGKLY